MNLAQLQQFIGWLMLIAFGFALFHLAVFLVFGDPGNGLGGLVVFAYGCVALYAYRQARQGRMVAAVVTLCAGLLAMIPAHVLVLPDLYPALAVAPLLVVAIALPYLPARALRWLGIACLGVAIVVPILGRWVRLLPPPPSFFTEAFGVLSVPAAIGMVVLLLWQFNQRLQSTLARVRSANADLLAARARVEATLAEQSKTLAEVQLLSAQQTKLLEENDLHRQAIRELSVPILPVSTSTLVIPLVGAFDTARLLQLQDRVLHNISETGAKKLVLDVSGVPVIDTQVAKGLVTVAEAARLLGAEMALVGIRPEVAQTLVGLGVQLTGLHSYSDLQAALARTRPQRSAALQ